LDLRVGYPGIKGKALPAIDQATTD
jgi:hypothetical protein